MREPVLFGRGLGADPDPFDPRDLTHSQLTGVTGAGFDHASFTPTDLRHTLPVKTWDQNGWGECVAMGGKAVIFCDHAQQLGDRRKVVPISEKKLWYTGRAAPPRKLGQYNVGMWPRLMFAQMRQEGYCANEFCPSDWPMKQQPSKDAEHFSRDQARVNASKPHPDGHKRKPVRYVRLDGLSPDEVCAQFREVMQLHGRVISFSMQIPKRLAKDDFDPRVPFDFDPDRDDMGGGHNMTAVVSLPDGNFIVRNSWGDDAHDSGHFIMSARCLGLRSYDRWYVLSSPLLSSHSYS